MQKVSQIKVTKRIRKEYQVKVEALLKAESKSGKGDKKNA